MKKLLLLLICLLLMAGTAQAAEVPQDLVRALPEDAAPLLRGQDLSGSERFPMACRRCWIACAAAWERSSANGSGAQSLCCWW